MFVFVKLGLLLIMIEYCISWRHDYYTSVGGTPTMETTISTERTTSSPYALLPFSPDILHYLPFRTRSLETNSTSQIIKTAYQSSGTSHSVQQNYPPSKQTAFPSFEEGIGFLENSRDTKSFKRTSLTTLTSVNTLLSICCIVIGLTTKP